MLAKFSLQNTLITLLIAGLLTALVHFQENNPHSPVKDTVTFDFNEGFPAFNPETVRTLSFGFPNAFASFLWIRFLLQTPPKSMGKNEVSWIFLDLNVISTIDPDFVPVYSHGAIYLSVVTEDKKGAQLIMERGVQRFPQFWRFRAYLAYHYQWEMQELRKAAEQYEIASRLPGAPNYFQALAVTLYQESGDTELARRTLESMIQNAADDNIRKRLQEKLDKLKAKP